MKTTLLAIKSRLKEFSLWLESLSEKPLLTQLAALFATVFLFVIPLSTLIGLIAVYVSWLPGFLVFTCLFLFAASVIIACTFKTMQQRAWQLARNSLVVLVCFWGGALIFGIVCGVATHTASHIVSSKLQLPLGELQAVAVDNEGRIYCASSFYKRLQVYDGQGNFLRGWFVPYLTKYSIKLKIDCADHIHAATSVGQRRGSMVFDSEGNLLETTQDSGIFGDSDAGSNLEVRDSKDNIYKIQSSVLFPRVLKITPSGEKSVLVSDSLNLWLIKASFPVFGFLMLTGVIIVVISLKLKKQRT